jgi:two-component system chemotaxis response regulator CheY
MRALVIDDSRAMRSILKKIMAEASFDVIEACHGREALERLKDEGAADVALVDWNLPEMSGLQFVQAVRSNPDYESMRLIMVTTEIEREQMAKALDAGADEYVMKPFTKEAILDKLVMVGLGVTQ